ncbi:polysaccharide pyruvyl transferase family protein [Garciella nitratireducens]|uniref:polysaccharide pyruvyl transferase family protein n=1 Tax=Garciella nitratireducens TaxID=218205 RepID=UPI000DEA2CD6|nr:polysaccharide pyruvyl transferase family protein [Garciella nitratireducens]RBP37824.1 polysaccharide pyruvyl transferase CsaB [Garciella nitratireducens]
MTLKIGIVGNYGHNNNGDEAILQGILNQIKDINEHYDIVIFSDNVSDTIKRYHLKSYRLTYKRNNIFSSILYTVVRVFKNIKEIDVLIIGGGQLLMDLFKRPPMLYCMYSILAKLAGKPVIYYCVGVGPISSIKGKFLIGLGLKNAMYISVRDIQSKRILNEKYKLGDKVIVASDPAFFLNPKNTMKKLQRNKIIGFTTLPYFNKVYWPKEDQEKYNRYIEILRQTIEKLIEDTDYNIILFSTVYPADVISSTDLYKKITDKSRVTNITENLNPYELLETINKCDLIVGTRLHSLILSVVCEKPIIGINYQSKVKNFMEKINLKEYCFNIDTMEAQEIYSSIEKIIKDKREYDLAVSKSIQALYQMRKESDRNLKKIKEIIENIKK